MLKLRLLQPVRQWFHRFIWQLRLRQLCRRLGSDVADEIRTDVLRKTGVISGGDLIDYVETRATQTAHLRVDSLMRRDNRIDPVAGNQLIAAGSRRAVQILSKKVRSHARGIKI